MSVCQWESGAIKNMKRDKIAKLAKVLKVSPLEIVGLSSSEDLAMDRDECRLIIEYRKQPQAVQDAIKRMLGL